MAETESEIFAKKIVEQHFKHLDTVENAVENPIPYCLNDCDKIYKAYFEKENRVADEVVQKTNSLIDAIKYDRRRTAKKMMNVDSRDAEIETAVLDHIHANIKETRDEVKRKTAALIADKPQMRYVYWMVKNVTPICG
jgi:hypothetical protein